MKARGVLLWHMMRQVHPKLPFKDIPNFRVRQLKVEQTVEELQALFKRISKMRLSDDDRDKLEMAFEVDMADAMKREGRTGEVSIQDGQLAIEGQIVSDGSPPEEA